MALCNSYSGKDTLVVINGRRILGYSDSEDAVTITYPNAPADIVEGMGGAAQINLKGDTIVTIDLKLLATHEDHKFISAIDSALRDGICVPMTIAVTQIATGEGGVSESCTIVGTATVGMGKGNSGERTWNFKAANWIKNDFNFI